MRKLKVMTIAVLTASLLAACQSNVAVQTSAEASQANQPVNTIASTEENTEAAGTVESVEETEAATELSTSASEKETEATTRGAQKLVNNAAKEEGDKFSFDTGTFLITPGEAADPVIEKLGTPMSTYQAPSCAFEGYDTVNVYEGFEVNTAEYKGEEVVVGIFITDSSARTREGISLDSTLDEVLTAYGDPIKEDMGQMTWESEEVSFTVVALADEVTSISYIGIFEA